MPIYEYKCEKCGEIYEVAQKLDEKPLEKCLKQDCGGLVKKIISKSSFQLKGGGWYKDRYSNTKNTNGGKTD